jgi:hypothetical protein
MEQTVTKSYVLTVGLIAAALVAGAAVLAVSRADGMVIDLAALAGLAICF